MEEMELNVMDNEEVDTDQIDFAEGWDDGEPDEPAEAADEADQPKDEEAAGKDEGPKGHEEQPEPKQEETFLTLKHMDQVRRVTREEAQALAQKGMDYDRIREERDQLKTYEREHKAAVDLVESYARRLNMQVGEYLDYCRQQELMQGGMAEGDAKKTVQLERREADVARREQARQAEQQRRESEQRVQDEARARLDRDVKEFMRVFPGVKASDVSKEVFQAAQKDGIGLVAAYAMHKAKAAESALEAERTNADNRSRSTGSLQKSEGAKPKIQDEFLRDWYESEDD